MHFKKISCLLSLCLVVACTKPKEFEYKVMPAKVIYSFGSGENEAGYKKWLQVNYKEYYDEIIGDDNNAKKEDEDEKGKNKISKTKKNLKTFFNIVNTFQNEMISHEIPAIDYFLNEMGKKGWELVSMSKGVIIFKRTKQKTR